MFLSPHWGSQDPIGVQSILIVCLSLFLSSCISVCSSGFILVNQSVRTVILCSTCGLYIYRGGEGHFYLQKSINFYLRNQRTNILIIFGVLVMLFAIYQVCCWKNYLQTILVIIISPHWGPVGIMCLYIFLYLRLLLCISFRLSASIFRNQRARLKFVCSACRCGCYIYRRGGEHFYIQNSRHFALRDQTILILIIFGVLVALLFVFRQVVGKLLYRKYCECYYHQSGVRRNQMGSSLVHVYICLSVCLFLCLSICPDVRN